MRDILARNKFHLSALILLVPLYFLPEALSGEAPRLVADLHHPLTIGPYDLTLVTADERPYRGSGGETVKDYQVHLRPGAMDSIRGIFLRVGKPRSLRAAGALAEGSPYRQFAHVLLPDTLTGDEELWLTIERWDGSIVQGAVPLAAVLGGKTS